MVISTQAETVLGWPGQDVLIVASSTSAAVRASTLLFNVDHEASVRYVAAQYAHAERLKANGADWLSADAHRLDFPFGDVDNPEPTTSSSGGDEGALTYLDTPQSQGLGRAVWPAALFLHERSGKSDIDGEIFDLTGRRRVIRYGPYIEMPVGLWKVVVPFTLWIDSAIVEIRVEWASSVSVTSVTEVIRQSGRYEVTLSQAWEEIGPCEIRIWLDRAVFDGTIQLHDPSVIRL
ncbi:hypothetical protein [Brevundimonas intermedia]|uniref:hypothetical protein n=1 Tax=Brevundimonas intermedia TaxID=74315 RepID=UPI003207BE10